MRGTLGSEQGASRQCGALRGRCPACPGRGLSALPILRNCSTRLPCRPGDIILRRLASGNAPPQEVAPETAEPNLHEEGPGHEEFTVLDNGRVKISNVQVKRVGSNGLRIGLDLRNPDNEKMLTGEISVTLLTADGQKSPSFLIPGIGIFQDKTVSKEPR